MAYTQDGRRLVVKTPLGKDVLLLTGFTGHEAISQPFLFQLDCVAENDTKIVFDGLLGQKVTVELSLPGGRSVINGVCLPGRAGGAGRDVHAYRPRPRAEGLPPDPKDAEPDLPAQYDSRTS